MTGDVVSPGTGAPLSDEELVVAKLLHRAERSASFGPTFFLTQLGSFVRDRCPRPEEQLPVVEIHLAGGEVLDVCHVIGLGPSWVALAVREDGPQNAMRTELVPYPSIVRVTICAAAASSRRIGFDSAHVPRVLDAGRPTPAELLARASTGATTTDHDAAL